MSDAERYLRQQLEHARDWARHGYQIGQQSATWHSGHRKEPDWLTEGWASEDLDASAELRRRCELDWANVRYQQQEKRLLALVKKWDTTTDTTGVVQACAAEVRKALEGDHTA